MLCLHSPSLLLLGAQRQMTCYDNISHEFKWNSRGFMQVVILSLSATRLSRMQMLKEHKDYATLTSEAWCKLAKALCTKVKNMVPSTFGEERKKISQHSKLAWDPWIGKPYAWSLDEKVDVFFETTTVLTVRTCKHTHTCTQTHTHTHRHTHTHTHTHTCKTVWPRPWKVLWNAFAPVDGVNMDVLKSPEHLASLFMLHNRQVRLSTPSTCMHWVFCLSSLKVFDSTRLELSAS